MRRAMMGVTAKWSAPSRSNSAPPTRRVVMRTAAGIRRPPPPPPASLPEQDQHTRRDRHDPHDRLQAGKAEPDERLKTVHDQPRAEQQHPDVLGELHDVMLL